MCDMQDLNPTEADRGMSTGVMSAYGTGGITGPGVIKWPERLAGIADGVEWTGRGWR